jgi:hypothetical protein
MSIVKFRRDTIVKPPYIDMVCYILYCIMEKGGGRGEEREGVEGEGGGEKGMERERV